MSSKLNFRARTLDVSKSMCIYHIEDLPELADLNAINRSVPAMPSGMEKEEEAEKHLQDILEIQEHSVALKQKVRRSSGTAQKRLRDTDLAIPTPEVFETKDYEIITADLYKKSYKPPKQYIHVQPFAVDRDQPDYNLDDEDADFLEQKLNGEKNFEVVELVFEEMIDTLEKNSGHSVISAREAKQLLKEDDDLILAVYDYWVDKRLRLRKPLIPMVKTDKREVVAPAPGSSGTHDPYMAFRRRTKKMQTRKNRKNEEVSYEKMLKLRRDLSRAVTLLELVRRREKTKKENLHLTADIFERRFTTADWDGKVMAEALAQRQQPHHPHRVLQAALMNMKFDPQLGWVSQQQQPMVSSGAGQKRSYKKKKKSGNRDKKQYNRPDVGLTSGAGGLSSDEDLPLLGSGTELEEADDGPFAFRRKRNCQYMAPLVDEHGFTVHRGWPWEQPDDGGAGEPKYRYSLASLSTPKSKCIGMARRRMGRGGRLVIDRAKTQFDELWRSMDFAVYNGIGGKISDESMEEEEVVEELPFQDWPHYRPVTPPHHKEEWDSFCGMAKLPDQVGLPTQPIMPTLTSPIKTLSAIGPLAAILQG